MANTLCSTNTNKITSAFISKEGHELLSEIKAPRYADYLNYVFGEVFKKEYLNNDSYVTLSDFTDSNNKLTVSDGLSNLYNKAKEELKNQLNPEMLNLLPDETKKDLIQILKNWKLFIDYHSKYNAYIKIKEDDLEEKDQNNYDKRGNEHTEFDLVSNEIRTLFKLLPKAQIIKDTDGNITVTPEINPEDGLPIRSDFENTFKLTLDTLKGIKDEDLFIEKLTSQELFLKVPEINFLLEILPVKNIDNLTDKQRWLFHQFYQVMSRDYIPVYASSITSKESDLPSHIRYKSAKNNIRKIEKQFVNNFISSREENEYVKIENIIDEKDVEKSVYGRRRLMALPEKLEFINISIDDLNKMSVQKIKSTYKAYFDFYKLLGIEFSDFNFIQSKKDILDLLNNIPTIYENIEKRLKNNERLFNPIENIQSKSKIIIDGKIKSINSLKSVVQNILKFEGNFSKVSPTLVVKSATGENQADITYANAISIAASQLNSVNSLEELYNKPYFKKLKYNPLHNKTFVSTIVIPNKNISYEIENYSGNTTKEDDSIKSSDTKSLSASDKFISDFGNLMGFGTINTPQLESKAAYFAIKFVDKANDKAILPFTSDIFKNDFITNSEFTAQIINYLHGEIDRVDNYKNVKQYAPKNYGEFHIFKDFIKSEDILKDKNTLEYQKAEENTLSNINSYFNQELNRLKNFIFKNDIKNFVSEQVLNNAKITPELFKSDPEYYTDMLLRSFIANAFVHNVEFGIFVSGDPLFFEKPNKNEYHKRLGGLSSTGTQPLFTKNLNKLLNSDKQKLYWDNFSLRGVLNQFEPKKAEIKKDNSDTFFSGVLEEKTVKINETAYGNESFIDDFIYSYKLSNNKDITKEEVENLLKINTSKIDVGDGQGYLNLDAAREFSMAQGTYRPQQDVSYKFEGLIFKQMLLMDQGKDLDKEELQLLNKLQNQILKNPDKYGLPTLKQTFYGNISNENIQIDAKVFDKFSLSILFPSVARKHPELKSLLLAMAKNQVSYVKFESGSKGFIRETYKNGEELNQSKEYDELQTSLLKLQITPSKTEKTSTGLATQQIKLLFANLFDSGNSTDKVKEIRDNFINSLNTIQSFNRAKILRKFGFKLDDNKNIISWNKEKIIDAMISQVNLQKLPVTMLEALDLDEDGSFKNAIESSQIYQQLSNYIIGKLDSTLRTFKVKGADFVLISEAMYKTPLNYFKLNKDKTEILACDCRITLTKEFQKLLNLEDFEHPSKKISSIERLNQLLTNENFREKYQKELTISFARPPVQGQNSMGFAIVKEFFYPTMGNTLQLPKEFMYQAGIDFDYDKEKVFLPSLTEDGVYFSDNNLSEKIKAIETEFSELRDIYDAYEEEKENTDLEENEIESYSDFIDFKNKFTSKVSYTEFVSKYFDIDVKDIPARLAELDEKTEEYFKLKYNEKELLSNNLLESIISSLKLPENFSETVLPNTDKTVKPMAAQNGNDIGISNKLPSGINTYSYLSNLEVFKTFNDAKRLLGPFALNNVFTQLISPLNISLNLDYNFNKDGAPLSSINLLLSENKSRKINISSKYDEDGNVKQHITSEFINATVDSAKDPYFANFMLSFDNINTFIFLMNLNIPVDKIVDFTSSAVVRKYLDFKEKGLNLSEALSATINLVKGTNKNLSLKDALAVDINNINKDNTELLNKLKDLKNDESLENKDLIEMHTALLANFIAMEEHAKQYSNFKSLFLNDTNKTSSIFEIKSKEILRNNVINAGMFSEADILKIENNSTISAFRNDDLIEKVIKTAFPLLSDEIVSLELGKLFNESKEYLKDIDKRILSQVITNDYITSILLSFGEYKDENIYEYGKKLITKQSANNITLLERLHKLKQHKEYKNLIKQFPVLTKILSEISENPIKKNPVYNGGYAFNILLNIDPNLPLLDKENFMRQFKQILKEDFETEDPNVKTALVNFTKDFFIGGLIQSGFNKGGISFIEYAPVSFIQELLNPALDLYNKAKNADRNFIKTYLNYFNYYFKLNNSKYFNIYGDMRSFITQNSHLGKNLYIPIDIKATKDALNISTQQKTELDNTETSKPNIEINTLKVIGLNESQRFTRESAKKDIDYMYLFTDNAGRTSGSGTIDPNSWYAKKYGTDKKHANKTQAVARGLENAYPITTMVDDKRTQWVDAQFDEYKKIIDDEITTIKQALKNYKGIKFGAEMPFGKGAISNMKDSAPKIWNYLNEKLKEIRIDNSGEKPVSIGFNNTGELQSNNTETNSKLTNTINNSENKNVNVNLQQNTNTSKNTDLLEEFLEKNPLYFIDLTGKTEKEIDKIFDNTTLIKNLEQRITINNINLALKLNKIHGDLITDSKGIILNINEEFEYWKEEKEEREFEIFYDDLSGEIFDYLSYKYKKLNAGKINKDLLKTIYFNEDFRNEEEKSEFKEFLIRKSLIKEFEYNPNQLSLFEQKDLDDIGFKQECN